MNILFLGLGSIGQRHARLLRRHFPEHALYALRSGNGKAGAAESLGIPEIDWKRAEGLSGGVAFITNPTSLHLDTALRCARMGMHLFLEKPIGSTRRGLVELAEALASGGLASYVAYNLRFHPVIEALKHAPELGGVASGEVEALSWLPDWRPGTDHLKSYSARAADGGGVLLDLSHELDYVGYLFGGVTAIRGEFGRRSGVTVDAEDFADLRVSTGAGADIRVLLDIGCRTPRRGLRFRLRDGRTVQADLLKSVLRGPDGIESHLPCDQDLPYERQLRYFFATLASGPMNSLPEAAPLFEKILSLKEAA